jgi:hypothetical protein
MGALVAYLAAQATAVLKRKALIYGLMAIGGLLAVFAAGYALSAGHTMLMFRYGSITASLIVAGGLLVLAIGCGVAAKLIARRPLILPPPTSASRYSTAPYRMPYTKQRMLAVAAALAGAASAGAALIRFKRLRLLLRGRGA